MNNVFLWIERLSFSTWVRNSLSLWAFPTLLYLHTLGMSIVAGVSLIIALIILGVRPKRFPLSSLEKLYPAIWFGFVTNAITGVAIFTKDASTYGNNADFYIKLVFVALAMWLMMVIRTRVLRDPQVDLGPVTGSAKLLAWASIVCWYGAEVTGRLIAYTNPTPGGG